MTPVPVSGGRSRHDHSGKLPSSNAECVHTPTINLGSWQHMLKTGPGHPGRHTEGRHKDVHSSTGLVISQKKKKTGNKPRSLDRSRGEVRSCQGIVRSSEHAESHQHRCSPETSWLGKSEEYRRTQEERSKSK